MKLNPFTKKSNTGYLDRLKVQFVELTKQVQAAEAEADAATADYENKLRICQEIEALHANKQHLTNEESVARRVRNDAHQKMENLSRVARELDFEWKGLHHRVHAPARLEGARQSIERLSTQRDAKRGDIAFMQAKITQRQTDIEELMQRSAQEWEAARKTIIDPKEPIVIPNALKLLDAELRGAQASLELLKEECKDLQVEIQNIPAQIRLAKEDFSSAQATLAEIELQEQLPNWIDLIALAAVSADLSSSKYVIEIPYEVAQAAREKLAAEVPAA